MAVLKEIDGFLTLLIGVEGAKTPAGVRGRGDPAGAKSAEEAPRHARGKRSTWSANQQTNLTQPFKNLDIGYHFYNYCHCFLFESFQQVL
jgi:hypothetical protein